MVKSMTGFASVTREDAGVQVGVTIRAVNHRYLDVQLRLPATLMDLEPGLRGEIQRLLSRGRVEVAVTVQSRRLPQVDVELNAPLIAALAAALDQARDQGLVQGTLTPGDLLRVPQALSVRETAPGEADGDTREAVTAVVTQALSQLDVMRAREGEFLRADLDARLDAIAALVDRVEQAAADGQAALQARLAKRVEEVAADFQADAAALAQEVVRFVARSDVSEELTRLRGHFTHWRELVAAPPPCGRKLDFLLQEMHREINTLGAKSEGAAATELIVAAKAELEKMREQVQNVE